MKKVVVVFVLIAAVFSWGLVASSFAQENSTASVPTNNEPKDAPSSEGKIKPKHPHKRMQHAKRVHKRHKHHKNSKSHESADATSDSSNASAAE